MADVQTEIEKISSAVYGEEVRGAMVNSLTKIAAEVDLKADTIKILPACEGAMTFAPYSNFILGQVGTSGTYNPDIKYRVTSEDIMQFDYDLNISVDDGFTAYVVKFENGTYVSIKSLSDTNGYVIPANTEFRLHIRRTVEDTTETANINEFVSAVKFQTKIAAEVALKADKADVDAALALKADNCSVVLSGEGLSDFVPYSSFVRGNARSTDGTINKDTKYRVTSENIMQFDYDLNISVDDGFTAYVVKFENGTYVSIKSLSDTNGYVIPANTEFRLHIRRTVEDTTETANINEFVSAVKFQTKIAAEVTDVDERVKSIENVIQDDNNYKIPDYYFADNYITDKINEIKQNCNILHGVTFAFITDVHFKVNQRQSKKLLKKIMDETNIPFVIFGGDAIYLYGTEDELNEQVAEFNSFKSYIGKNRLFCTRGNHDLYNVTSADRTMHSLTMADVYDTFFRDSEDTVSSMSAKNGCYCIDNEPQKTRIIMLNTSDLSSEPDNEGGGVLFRGSTLEWLSGVLTEKKGYKIIIVCHTPLNYEKFGNDNSSENPDGLQQMIAAFKNKTTFTTTRFNVEVNADFTNTTNELVCVVSGHRHIDDYSIENNVLNIVTTCDCIDTKDGYGRKAGTVNEQAFDIFCIDYDANTIKTVRVGAGSNRSFDIDVNLSAKVPEDEYYTKSEIDVMFENSNSKSAYEIAVENGFEGTEAEWLTSLRGADGKDGVNGSNGKDGQDYVLTATDKQEIASLASNTISVQAPIFVDSVDKMTDTSRLYVLSSTGEIWAYMNATTEQEVTITDNIVSTTDNPYQGGRLSSDGTVNNDVATTHIVTPYIDLSKYNGKTIQIHLDGNRYVSESPEVYIMYCVYSASKTSVSGRLYSTAETIASINGCSTAINGTTSATLTLDVPTTFGSGKTAMQYIRFCGLGTEVASNVYITYTDAQTVTGEQWVNTHTTYAPTLTADDKNEIAEEVANMVDTELLGLVGTGTVTV